VSGRPARWRRAGLLLGLAWSMLAPGRVLAAEPAPAEEGRFAFTLQACPGVSAAELRRILAIEIGDLLLDEAEGVPAGRDHLTIRCVGTFAFIQATGPGSATPYEQIVHLDAFPGDALPRAVALAGLELLASLNATVRERIANPRPPAPPSPPPVAVAAPAGPAAPVVPRRSLGLSGTWRVFPGAPGAPFWGGQARFDALVATRWILLADVEAARARTPVVDVGEASAWLLSAAVAAGWHADWGSWRGWLAVGARAGGARLGGTSLDPSKVTGLSRWYPWGGPLASLGVSRGRGPLALTVCLEVGRTLARLEGTIAGRPAEDTMIAIQGSWVGIGLGAAFQP
jgi:hypothetical protein